MDVILIDALENQQDAMAVISRLHSVEKLFLFGLANRGECRMEACDGICLPSLLRLDGTLNLMSLSSV
ncbi:hypothetical protein [Synechococcus sp. CCAP 1479/9]|uniref:hypothetical protein n=1 Tax=Synechococcus sp. CCAP 1479/9 TaxID=1221593 RepID=UPI001C236863|nr:hypothetical protein [Synechococcus sp. CCAP 1479/9]